MSNPSERLQYACSFRGLRGGALARGLAFGDVAAAHRVVMTRFRFGFSSGGSPIRGASLFCCPKIGVKTAQNGD
jgi:hypothetical protein